MNLFEEKAYQPGKFFIELRRKNGELVKKVSLNTIVNAGKAALASRINGNGGEAAFTYLAVGTNSTAVSGSDTALGAETVGSGLSRAAATASRVTTSVTNDTARLSYTFTVSGSVAITELGVFNNSSGGTMLCRTVFSALNVVSGDSLTINYDVQAS